MRTSGAFVLWSRTRERDRFNAEPGPESGGR
jgi:hypothetical protein